MTDIDHRILQGMFYRALMINYGYPGFDGPRLLRIIIAIIAADLCAPDGIGMCATRNPQVTINTLGDFTVGRRTWGTL